MRPCILLTLLPLTLLANGAWNEPWGKDAALASNRPIVTAVPQNWLQRTGDILIRFHQEVISPVDGPRSHYVPSSSQYTKEAISKYGFFKGVVMGCDRLMRENGDPWVYPTVISDDGRKLKEDAP